MSADPSTPFRAGIKPYPAMKDSGVVGMGEVPEHWNVGTLRRKLRPYDGIKIGPFGSQLKLDQMSEAGYKVYGQANVIAHDFTRGMKFVDEQKFKELSQCAVRSNDLLVTMMGTSGRCARVPDGADTGIMDSHLLRLRTDATVDVGFAALVLDRSSYVKDQISIAGKGSIMHGLNSAMVKDLVLAIPSLPEQAAIVRFLDHADRRIRRYIRAKQKLIKLLEEQKQAIIHRAVARGLDPDVSFKPSGVRWLGDVPESWEVVPLRHLLLLGPKNGVSPVASNVGGVLSFSIAAVRDGHIRVAGNEKYIALDAARIPGFRVRAGDVLLVRGNGNVALVAQCGLVGECPDDCVYPDLLMKLRPNTRLLPEFMVAAINSPYVSNQVPALAKTTNGTFKVSGASVRALALAVPSLSEQKAILQHLSCVLEKVDRAREIAGREIALLREHRTRLIADVVTGKIDVREAAAQLPDVEESEAITEVEELIDDAATDESESVVEFAESED